MKASPPKAFIPVLYVTALAMLAGQGLTFMQPQLPLWLTLPAVLLPWAGAFIAVGLLFLNQLNVRNFPSLVFNFACAVFLSYAHSGLQSNQFVQQQIPLDCMQKTVSASFKLLNIRPNQDGVERWIIRILESPSRCLKADSQISLKNTNSLSGQIGAVYTAALRLRPPRGLLPMHGQDMATHWFSNHLAGFATSKGPIKILRTVKAWDLKAKLMHYRYLQSKWLETQFKHSDYMPYLLALSTGEQSLISAQQRALLTQTGTAHLLAISGLHLGLIVALVTFLGRIIQRKVWHDPVDWPIWAGVFAGLLYGLVAGWSVSVQRAFWMVLALYASKKLNGKTHLPDAIACALLLTLFFDPFAVLRAGFWLSFSAISAIALVHSGHLELMPYKMKWRQKWHMALKTQYAITLCTLIPLGLIFHQVSIVAPMANALSIVWMSCISTPLTLFGLLFHSAVCLHLSIESLKFQDVWLQALAQLSWAAHPVPSNPSWVWLLAGTGVVLAVLPLWRWRLIPALLMISALWWPLDGDLSSGEFRLTLLDIGQGSAMVLDTQNHRLIFDTGPSRPPNQDSGRQVIQPWLLAHSRKKLDDLWISHNDNDHSGGAAFLIAHHPFKRVVSSLERSNPLNEEANNKNIPTFNCHHLKPWTWDGVSFTPLALWQSKDSKPAPGDNNQSCVLRVGNGFHSVLMTGDIEAPAEHYLVHHFSSDALQSEILIAPHHGSNSSSTPAFLNAVQAKIVLIQSGWKNRYHHPHPMTIRRYQQAHLQILNTAQIGALSVKLKADSCTPLFKIAGVTHQEFWDSHESSANGAIHW